VKFVANCLFQVDALLQSCNHGAVTIIAEELDKDKKRSNPSYQKGLLPVFLSFKSSLLALAFSQP
jgi:hypothetical protein